MASINPFNGRKDLRVTFYGENKGVIAAFDVIAIDYKNPEQLAFLNEYADFKPHENNGIEAFKTEVGEKFMEIGALRCQMINSMEAKEVEIKFCKCEVTKDW